MLYVINLARRVNNGTAGPCSIPIFWLNDCNWPKYGVDAGDKLDGMAGDSRYFAISLLALASAFIIKIFQVAMRPSANLV